MKLLGQLLFYYSLIAMTILIAVSFFLLPKPQNIANTLLLAPVVLFFWIQVTNPNKVNASTWSARFVLVVFFLTSLGVFAYFLSIKNPTEIIPSADPTLSEIKTYLEDSRKENEEFRGRFENEISSLKNKIDRVGSRVTLGVSTPPEGSSDAAGQITPSDPNLNVVPVYKSNSTESMVLGSIEYGDNYSFFGKRGDWYLITDGWVEASMVTVLNTNQ